MGIWWAPYFDRGGALFLSQILIQQGIGFLGFCALAGELFQLRFYRDQLLQARIDLADFLFRDLFDLAWYLSDPEWPTPNLGYLNNALQQTGWSGRSLNERNWHKAVRERLQMVSWEEAVDDVTPFLGPGADPAVLNKDNIMRLLR